MRKDGFTVCAKHYIKCLRQEGRYATAHVYESALRSFTMFCGTAGVSFRQITRGNLKRYSSYLMDCHLRLNTISTYMRMLRCIYNRGVDREFPQAGGLESADRPHYDRRLVSANSFRGGFPISNSE